MRTGQELTYIAYLSRLTKGRVLIQYMAHQAWIPAYTVRILDGIWAQQHYVKQMIILPVQKSKYIPLWTICRYVIDDVVKFCENFSLPQGQLSVLFNIVKRNDHVFDLLKT